MCIYVSIVASICVCVYASICVSVYRLRTVTSYHFEVYYYYLHSAAWKIFAVTCFCYSLERKKKVHFINSPWKDFICQTSIFDCWVQQNYKRNCLISCRVFWNIWYKVRRVETDFKYHVFAINKIIVQLHILLYKKI